MERANLRCILSLILSCTDNVDASISREIRTKIWPIEGVCVDVIATLVTLQCVACCGSWLRTLFAHRWPTLMQTRILWNFHSTSVWFLDIVAPGICELDCARVRLGVCLCRTGWRFEMLVLILDKVGDIKWSYNGSSLFAWATKDALEITKPGMNGRLTIR